MGALVSLPAVPQGGPSLLCDLVFHMIEICLILLRVNVSHRRKGDSRREGKGRR